MNEIKKYILNNKIIKDYFNKVPQEYRDDFIQHIWLIILELMDKNSDKIKKLYDNRELGKFIVGIITNQLKSNTSSFHKEFRTTNVVFDENIDIVDEEYIEINNKELVKKIIKELDSMHYVDTILFKMYRGIHPQTNKLIKPLTYSEIEAKTGIKYQTVWHSINKVTKILKKKIIL